MTNDEQLSGWLGLAPFLDFGLRDFPSDIPKNYQITQYDRPSTANGFVEFEFSGTGFQPVQFDSQDACPTKRAGGVFIVACRRRATVLH
jgi:hypothetical protein